MEYEKNVFPISLPYIEKPVVKTGMVTLKAISDEFVSGFTEAPGKMEEYNYEYCRYHWEGNGPGPRPVVTHSYYADFYAMVSGSTHMEVRSPDGTIIVDINIPFTETVQNTIVTRLIRKDAPYDFSRLTFIVKNNAGMESSVAWSKENQFAEHEKPIRVERGDKWEYPLMRLIWSLTNHCNLGCRHCAFRDIHNNMTELSGSEICSVVKEIIELGVPDVSLSGGEILLSPYWYETARTLSLAGVKVSIITNGTLIDHDSVIKIKDAGIQCVSVSIDDFQGQIETIRDVSSYEKAVRGIKLLKAAEVPVSIVTTVHALNLHRLDEMRSAFTESGAEAWCLKPILPVGEAARNPQLWLKERDINKVIDFCYSAIHTVGLPVIPALSFEMHSEKGAAVLRYLYGEDIHTDFYGSDAGIFSAQLHPDGSLVPICMYSPCHSAGNIKVRSLADIWQDKRSFKALREFDSSLLSGQCGVCGRRDTCKGGELNPRLAFGGINAENKYCAYRNFTLHGINT